MKKVLSILIAFSMILSVFAAMPIVANASEATLEASLSYTHASGKNATVTMHSHPSRPYAISWTSGTDGYRSGYIAFPFGDIDLKCQYISKATLNLTISKTQNMNESNSAVNIYAVDYAKVDGINAPTSDILLTTYRVPDAVKNQGDYSYNVSIDIDLSEYLEEYPDAEGVGILLTNRDDIYSIKGMVGFCGTADGNNAPTLSLEYGATASARISLVDEDGTLLGEKTIEDLTSGNVFEISEDVAPSVIEKDGKFYARGEFENITLESGVNTIEIVYSEETIAELIKPENVFSVISGSEVILPKKIEALLSDDKTTVLVDAEWETKEADDKVEVKATYGELSVKFEVGILPCDGELDSFTGTGASSGAGFDKYNKLNNVYGAGNTIFDCEFYIDEGSNKLISYGNEKTDAFGNAAALLRYMNTDVFEYHNGDWKKSDIKCETGKTYNLRTEINVTNKTYRMYIASEDGIYREVTDGDAKFRGDVSTIDRFFFHGSGSATGTDVVKNHRESWVDGFTYLTVNYLCDGEKVMDKTFKWGTNTSYKDNSKAIGNGEEIYVIPDFNNPPVKSSVTGEEDSFDVAVKLVTAKVSELEDVYISEGDESIVLPWEVKVEFSDGQSLVYQIKWDTADVDVNNAGTYTAKGAIGELGIFAECDVIVKGVTNIEYTPGNNTVVTNNGGWNWYVEPSGTHIQPGDDLATLFESGTYTSNNGYVFTEDKTYMGWVEDGGDIVISSLDHNTGEHKRVVIHEKLESDDHNNPAVIVLPDGRIMAVYTMHTNEPYLYYRVTKYPEDISEWNDEQFYYCKCTAQNDTNTYNPTYPSVFVVHDDCGIEGNDVIYMGWRGVHWKPTLAKFSIPDENGVSEIVMGQTQFANTTYYGSSKADGGKSDGGRRPYTKYDYDVERNKLYMTFTANHPDNDARNHIYYLELDIADQNLYTASGRLLQPLPVENSTEYISKGANGTNGQWGVITVDLVNAFPELVVFDASEQTGMSFTSPNGGGGERRGWTWDIAHNEKGEPCIVYVDVTATPPVGCGKLPEGYVAPGDDETDPEHATRSHHYYWYARWDSETGEWVKTFLTYGGKWWHQNYKQERCYSGGLTLDHNHPGNVIYLAIPTYGKYGNIFEIYRWESDDNGETWTKREALTKDSPTPNARPNAIYNYKKNADGTHAGPRLLWKSGEYRYWLNYEYKTGVWTDYATEGFITQDDPEMFADFALLGEGGEELSELPVGEDVTVTAKFTVSNISIGDGQAKLAIAHYSKDNVFKKFTAIDSLIPARSVPQIGVVGAPKIVDDGSHSPWAEPENRSTMGDSEVVETIDYTANIEEGDRITLFAWGVGIEHPWHPLSDLNYSITTEGTEFLFSENFAYDGKELLVLDKDEDTFKGWIAKGFNSSGEVEFNAKNYAAITKAPFGNTALHLYRRYGEGIMASHALPDTNGEAYTLEFTMRYISELAWNRTDNIGFTLSHGVPKCAGDATNPSAYQFRHRTNGGNENGRGVVLFLKDSIAFDTGDSKTVANTGIPRDWDVSEMEQIEYSKGIGYFDPEKGIYIHDYNDSLMSGALLYITVKVSPANRTIETSVCDGYRTTTHTATYNGKDSVNWDENPIDTITFSLGNENVGEVYVDDIKMYIEGNK